ncbi:MAG: hypothetical protein HC811_01680 [Flammeovirgaceae bacterium]|nr:hypothetical protein [Flammeovirgaceae bacterium]
MFYGVRDMDAAMAAIKKIKDVLEAKKSDTREEFILLNLEVKPEKILC